MSGKNIIIGTAGHVDHGKTLLIKALTGIDTDRLQEEKKRGITIELGFAFLDLPGGERAGIVDVPGHEKFIKNMLAGAGGIDLALLVIAADDGVMPQTREHLGILRLLGIRSGIVVITKTDLVDADWLELVMDDVRQSVTGSFLQDAPILPVSAYTGQGLEELRAAIAELVARATQKNTQLPCRVPVDRVFSVDGFGTVITGTLIEGELAVGQDIQVYPGGATTRVRNLQVHSADVDTAYAGQRVAVNLAGLKRDDVARGDTLAPPGSLRNTMMLDVKLSILGDSERIIENGSTLHFYHGAREILCKLVLLERDRLLPGEEGYAQLRFSEEIAVKLGDRFVVRFYSPVETVGGGVVLHPTPAKHRRNNARVLADFHTLEQGSLRERLLLLIAEGSFRFAPLEEIRAMLQLDEAAFSQEIQALITAGDIFPVTDQVAVDRHFHDTLAARAEAILAEYHAANPLQAGMRADELRSRLLPGRDASFADPLLSILASSGVIVLEKQKARLPSFQVRYSEAEKAVAERLEAMFRDGAIAPPGQEELDSAFPQQKAAVKKLLEAMLADGALVAVAPQIYFHRDAYADAVDKLTEHIRQNGQITLAEFRDLTGSSRRFALALLEYFDRHGVTKKTGDVRILARR